MGGHFTVHVAVKEVIEPHPVENSKGFEVKGVGGTLMTERRVIDRLAVTVSAGSEDEAIARVIQMLETQWVPNPFAPPAAAVIRPARDV